MSSSVMDLNVRLLLLPVLLFVSRVGGQPQTPTIEAALAAEARFDTATALSLFLSALEDHPDDPYLLQKIARQYSDYVADTEDRTERKRRAELALEYGQRALALQPDNPQHVLTVAIAQGKIALASDANRRIELSRQVRAGAERALELDQDYAWAHHVLGRWHFEVVRIGGPKRFFARLVYGGLPSGSLEEAASHLQQAVELEPDNLLHQVELGFVLDAMGRTDEARELWQRSLMLPERQKDDAAAKQRARQALAITPASPRH